MKKFKKVADKVFAVLYILSMIVVLILFGMEIGTGMLYYYILFLAHVIILLLYMKVLQVDIKLLEGKMNLAEAKLNLRITENKLDSIKDIITLAKWIENNHDLSTANAKLLINIVKPKISK